MDFSLSDEERAIRDTARDFIRKEIMVLEPEVLRRERDHRPALERSAVVELQQKAKSFGFWGLSTPEADGGMNLPAVMQALIAAELGRTFVPFSFGGEADNILYFCNTDQRKEYLEPTISGERRSCFAITEPGAGSDLASLRTSALLDGDEYVVNGQKVWTSYADKADWIFCLVRTDAAAPKHLGISFLLFDMASPGVSTSPIKLISGYSPFCQTFFDDVRVPRANLMGTAGKGWDIAKYLLTHEREMIGDLDDGRRSLSQIAVKALGEAGVAPLRSDIVRHEINALAFGLTMERVKDETKAGQGTGALSSMLKYYGTELNKQRQELLMSVGGSDSLAWSGTGEVDTSRHWLRSRANSIEGGTSEVQLNIIAKRVLQLPGA